MFSQRPSGPVAPRPRNIQIATWVNFVASMLQVILLHAVRVVALRCRAARARRRQTPPTPTPTPTLKQLICSVAVICIVRYDLESYFLVADDAGGVAPAYVCFMASPDFQGACTYAYSVAAVSILFCFVLSLMQVAVFCLLFVVFLRAYRRPSKDAPCTHPKQNQQPKKTKQKNSAC